MAIRHLAALAALSSAVVAAPNPATTAAPSVISNQNALQSALSAYSAGAMSYGAIISAIQPQATPTSPAQAASIASAGYAAYSNDPLGAGAEILLSGLAGGDFASDINGFGICNSYANINPRPAFPPVYPVKAPGDAPYDVSEAALRAAINIPSGFKYGAVTPLLFIPGTGVEACENFTPNLAKLLSGSSYADPVFVNVPNNMLADLQTSAEYVAYAINYISRISGNKKVAIATWSAGSLVTQWAHKYWPSTRSASAEVINISGDIHGTVLAPIICPPGLPCAPSVLQQFYNSKFIATLRNNGGDSSYVTTTSIWNIFDEIVEPQQNPNASAMLQDARNVGVTNAQIQDICPLGTLAYGPNFGHEEALYNPVTYALIVDALKNAGPANVARSGAASMCNLIEAPGLDLEDLLASEFLIPLAGFNIETYPFKVTTEPAIKAYAAGDTPSS